MRMTIESTSKVVELNGVPCRIWEGRTAGGVAVHCFVVRVAAPADADLSEFERELAEHQAPSPDAAVYPARLVL